MTIATSIPIERTSFTRAATASAVNGAKDEERRTLMMVCKTVGNVGDLRVQFKDLPILPDFRPRPLLYQGSLTGNGDDLFLFGGGDSQSSRKIGIRVGVHRQDLPATAGHEEDQGGSQRRFTGASFSGDSKLQ